jgi:hypothetical protein
MTSLPLSILQSPLNNWLFTRITTYGAVDLGIGRFGTVHNWLAVDYPHMRFGSLGRNLQYVRS